MLDKLFSIPTSTSSPVGEDWGEGKTTAPISDDLEDEIHFVWDGSHLLQEVYLDGRYTYIYTNPDRKGQTKLYPTLPPSPVGEGKTI